jgi:hypothetical protein
MQLDRNEAFGPLSDGGDADRRRYRWNQDRDLLQ